jgi:hypothetical protein
MNNSNAIAASITLTPEEITIVRNEIQRLREENARLGVKEVRYNAYMAAETASMRKRYMPSRRSHRLSDALIVPWAMFWLVVYYIYDRLSAINRSA